MATTNPIDTNDQTVTIVSGLPRSGTSLMMQMLAAGGMPLLTDNIRRPDEENPRGYFEFEPVKQLKRDHSWLAAATGKAVKIIHLLLYELPPDRSYRVVFMRRKLNEVLASQQKMLQRSGRQPVPANEGLLTKAFESQIVQVRQWLAQQPHFRVLEIWHHDVMAKPGEQAALVNQFLGSSLNESAMTAVVEVTLHRNRG
jgi:hypothetical protein